MFFEELHAFLIVAEQGSFLSAAETLGTSRTTLRRQVDAIEAQAGVPLLRRHRTGIELTEAGRQLLARGKVMEQEFGSLLHAIRQTSHRPEGQVRVLLPVGLPPTTLAMFYSMFRASWPAVQVQARYHDDPLSTNLSEVDVLVSFGDASPRGAWEVYPVLEVRQRLVAARGYLEARGAPRSVGDLANHDLLVWLPPGQTSAALHLASGGIAPIIPALASTSVHDLHECARLGLGIAWVPDAGVPPMPGEEPLVPVLEDAVGSDLMLQMAVPKNVATLPRVRVFIDSIGMIRSVAHSARPASSPRRKPDEKSVDGRARSASKER
jgi:DNA-binding transcriptional LysR family regulator